MTEQPHVPAAARSALERALPGWRVEQDDEVLVLATAGLPDGLRLEVSVVEEGGALGADVELSHPDAEQRLAEAHRLMRVTIHRELELEADPEAMARTAAAEAARLRAEAGTLDTFLAALGEDDDFEGDLDDVAAAARGTLAGAERPGFDVKGAVRENRERGAVRRAALAAVAARDIPDADARADALVAELAARGAHEDPLWIRRHAEAEPAPASWRGLAGDALRLVRRFRDGELGEAPPQVDGAWHAVALDPGADPALLTAAFDGADLRLGGTATIAAQLAPDGAVVLGDAVIGRVDGAVPAVATPTVLQLGRVGAGSALFAQVRIPE